MLAFIIPTRTDALLQRLLDSLLWSSPPQACYQIIVADNGLSPAMRTRYPQVRFVDVPEPFNFSRAVNLAAAHASAEADIVILNDDVVIESPVICDALTLILRFARVLNFGLISPLTRGGVGNPDQGVRTRPDTLVTTRTPVCFVAVAIVREVWDALGGMDERYVGYGYEDVDFCRRTVEAGWHIGVAGAAWVRHGSAGQDCSSTFMTRHGSEKYRQMSDHAQQIFIAKWGDGPQLGAYSEGAREHFALRASLLRTAPSGDRHRGPG